MNAMPVLRMPARKFVGFAYHTDSLIEAPGYEVISWNLRNQWHNGMQWYECQCGATTPEFISIEVPEYVIDRMKLHVEMSHEDRTKP